jgi:carbamoyltransferase
MATEYTLAVLDEIDASAALFKDGELVALGEEERFIREKHASYVFPTESIKYVLSEASIELSDVDTVAYGWDNSKYPLEMAQHFLDICYKYDVNEGSVSWMKTQPQERHQKKVNEEIVTELSNLSDEIPEIQFVDHHKSHAVSAFHYSGFDSSAVLTADGYGEQNTVTGWEADSDGLNHIFSYKIPDSLGWYMFCITTFLGFRANNGEGKVMGLAPYGEPDKDIRQTLENVLEVTSDGFQIDPSYIYYGEHSYHDRFTDKFVEEIGGEPREYGEEITQFHKNVAYEGQKLLEKAVLSCGSRLLDETDMNRLCYAGGVALNCKVNRRLREDLDIEELFVQPVAGDNGIPLGAGLIASNTEKTSSTSQMKTVYYGWKASPDQVTEAIENKRVEIISNDRTDTREKIVDELVSGSVVGRYSGRMECGPRALGNRSILADPSDEKNLIAVNEVKQREEWRPFAPTILAEYADKLLEGKQYDPFMIQTNTVKESQVEKIEAAVHVDNTTRPQVLEKEANENYWTLIDSFRQETGIPALLNTSFNLSGDPIVRTPEEAIETFLSSSIDYLQVEEYLLRESTV